MLTTIISAKYSKVFEEIIVRNNKFVCAYEPCYGLVRVNDNILKINLHEGYINKSNNAVIQVIYLYEHMYIDEYKYVNEIGFKKLTENEILKLLGRSECCDIE